MSLLSSLRRKKGTLAYQTYHKNISKLDTDIPDVCAECGGLCCKTCGCEYSPEDFDDLSFMGLKSIIDQGYISIIKIPGTMYNLGNDTYILRIRNKNENVVSSGLPNTTKDGCSLLTDTGCMLSYEKRPTGGKMLLPKLNNQCEKRYGHYECSREWSYYQDVLKQLVAYYSEIEATDKIENQLLLAYSDQSTNDSGSMKI